MSIAETVYEKLKDAPPELALKVLAYVETLQRLTADRLPRATRSWDELWGCLKGTGDFAGDPVEIQRRMRDEWDREWEK